MQNKSLTSLIEKELFCHEQDRVFIELKKRLGISDQQVYEAYEFYDSDVYGYDNDVYESIPIRFVQYLHARKYGSWHVQKNRLISSWLSECWPCDVVDVGYGIPQSYLLDRLPFVKEGRFTLLEKYNSAKLFGKQIVSIYDQGLSSEVIFRDYDMNLSSISEYSGRDVYLYLDSLEHAKEPVKILKETANAVHQNSKIILSLPIGEIVPVHSISWKSSEEIISWLNDNGLVVLRKKELAPNPKVDVFIASMNSNFSTLLLECKFK